MENTFKIGVSSTSTFVQTAMRLAFDRKITSDGRAILIEQFEPGERWDCVLIDARSPLSANNSRANAAVPCVLLLPPWPLGYERRPEWQDLPRYRMSANVDRLFAYIPLVSRTPESQNLTRGQAIALLTFVFLCVAFIAVVVVTNGAVLRWFMR
jgi:hypothetical protein